MQTRLVAAVVVTLMLFGLVAVASADESVILMCSPNFFTPETPPAVVVTSCDKSAGVAPVCPRGFTGSPEDVAVSCAQTLATFLSLSGFKLANVQASQLGPTYTIVGPTQGH